MSRILELNKDRERGIVGWKGERERNIEGDEGDTD